MRQRRAASPSAPRTRAGDVRATVDALQQFDPTGPRRLAVIGLLSFLTGISEAAVLACISAAALAATGVGEAPTLGPVDPTFGQALSVGAACLAVNVLAGFGVARLSSRLAAESGLAARHQLLDAYFGSAYAEKAKQRVADLQEILTTHVDRFLIAFMGLNSLLTALLSLVSFSIAALLIDPVALVALAAVGALVVAVQRPVARSTKTASTAFAEQRRRFAESATEAVLLAREMAVFGTTAAAGERLGVLDRGVADRYARTRFLGQANVRIYQGLALAVVLGGLALLGQNGDAEGLAGVAAVALILLRSLSYGQAVLADLQTVAEQRPFIDRLTGLIDDYRQAAPPVTLAQVTTIDRMDLDCVTFAYGRSVALADIRLRISAIETIGVVGPSGAGKTTLANLILRLYEPTEGRVTLNGIDIREIDDRCWHRLTAVVPQDPRLVHGTVADNIRFFRDVDDEAVERAAEAAHVADFIRGLPLGFDAPVGELGGNLSGGQRQRICIARALAGDPELLVLDEPTSALDGESEAAIQATLTELKGRVAMVLIAHRLSTLAICDRIVVMGDGRILDVGTPGELRERSAYFRDAMSQAGL